MGGRVHVALLDLRRALALALALRLEVVERPRDDALPLELLDEVLETLLPSPGCYTTHYIDFATCTLSAITL